MGDRYYITDVQLGMISAVVREQSPDIYDVFAVCDILKDVEYSQFMPYASTLNAIARAAQVMRKTVDITACYGKEDDRSDYVIEMTVPARIWQVLADALNVLDVNSEG